MPSNRAVRKYDRVIGTGTIAVFAFGIGFGYLFEDWEFFWTWMPVAGIALVIYLFYRLVLAVEFFAYNS